MKVLTKLLVVLGLVALTVTVACENKTEATTEAPAENAGEQPSADKPTEAAPAEEAKPEEKPTEGAAAPTEEKAAEPEAPAASN